MIGKFLCSCMYSLCNYLYFVSTAFQCQITFYSKQMNFLLCICSCMYVWFRWMFFRPDLGWMFGDKWWNSDIFVYSLLISFFFIFTDGFKNYFCQHWGETRWSHWSRIDIGAQTAQATSQAHCGILGFAYTRKSHQPLHTRE